MKTMEEFIQRLQNDPEFEQKAQAYENSDEFMEFVKGEGYDFTLDQLLEEFKHEQQATEQPVEEPPELRKTVEEFIQRLQDDPEFELTARAFENNDDFLEFVKSEGYDFTLDQLTEGLKRGKEPLNPPDEILPGPSKATVIPLSRLPDNTKIEQAAEPSPKGVEEGQKRPRTLSPKFEGISGGRRRGMKWRNVEIEET
ncbi:MAG: Nif11-like leader peptide family natural product precursor [Desulfobaccales bacterium]